MLKPLCSIIVAAYNEEKNIAQCLDCLVNQTYENIEIIIVDDGSTDQTLSIIQSYIQKNPYITYRYQENAGAFAARRTGLELAKGDFITFLDCDDILHLDSIEKALNFFNVSDVDIVLFNLYESKDKTNKNYKEFSYFTDEKLIDGVEAFQNCIGSWGVHGLGVYKKEVFVRANNCYLKENSKNFVNNDEVVTKLSFLYSRKIYISDAVYLYNFNPNSVTRRINKDYVFILKNSLIFEKICKKEGFVFNYSQVLFDDTKYVYNIFKKWRRQLPNKRIWSKTLKKCLKVIMYNDGLKILNFKNKLRFLRMYFYLIMVECNAKE